MTIADAAELAPDTTLRADVCIAGAGAAGITLARELARAGVDVLLLEGGGEVASDSSQGLYRADNVGRYFISSEGCRRRYLGGSTNCWAGWCRPFDAEDFDDPVGSDVGGWPFGLEQLLPYYARARRTVRIGAGEFDLAPIAQRAGSTLLPLDASRVMSVAYQFNALRFRTFYRAELEQTLGLRVFHDANVVDLRLDQAGRRLTHLECRSLAGLAFRVEAEDFVLAMGGIENPRMLLAANSQVASGIGNEQGLVGRYFMEHPHLLGVAYLAAAERPELAPYQRAFSALTVDDEFPDGIDTSVRGALALPPELRQREQLVNSATTLTSNEQAEEVVAPLTSDVIGRLMGVTDEMSLYRLDLRAEQRPIWDSRVYLSDERDELGVRKIVIDWNVAARDIADLERTLEIFSLELGRTGVGRLWIPPQPASDWRVYEGCHHMGATRMATSPETGVVDPNCRVFGVDNLFVGGCSVYPTGGYANPTLTLIALAHRLADTLVQRWEARA